jgi:hypothetical protein
MPILDISALSIIYAICVVRDLGSERLVLAESPFADRTGAASAPIWLEFAAILSMISRARYAAFRRSGYWFR